MRWSRQSITYGWHNSDIDYMVWIMIIRKNTVTDICEFSNIFEEMLIIPFFNLLVNEVP